MMKKLLTILLLLAFTCQAAFVYNYKDRRDYLLQDGSRNLAGEWDLDNYPLENVNIDSGAIDPNVTHTEWDAAYTHVSSDGSDHTYIDQDVTTTGTPLFTSVNSVYINYTADGNFSFGDSTCLDALTTGDYNIAIGSGAGTDLTEGVYTVLIGPNAGGNITIGSRSIILGYNAGLDLTTQGYNTLIGHTAGTDCTSSYNTALGAYALSLGVGGSGYNTGIGDYALYGNGASAKDHAYNTAIGAYAGYSIDSGDYNIFIGYKAGYNQTNNDNLLIIDNQDRGSVANEITNSLIYGVHNATPSSQTINFNAKTLSRYGVQTIRSTADVSNPPTDAEIDAIFGNPSAAGEGFIGIIDDNDAGANVYLVVSTGTDADKWKYTALSTAP